MIFTIRHRTTYTYTDRVFLEPHTLRLIPRSDAMQHCHSFSVGISPQPAGQTRILDLDGNPALQVWFDRLTDKFEITTTSVIETLCTNPFYFLLTVSEELPFEYPTAMQEFLQPYIAHEHIHPDVRSLGKRLAEETSHEIMPFLTALTSWIFHNIEQVVRDEGQAHPSHQTFHSTVGSCRDTTVLFMDVCRTLGLATRFVSGYVLSTGLAETERHLHAWAEIYLPGAGWRGFDPSRGLAVSDAHIALAAAHSPILASPVYGMFRSNHAQSKLSFLIEMEEHQSLQKALQG